MTWIAVGLGGALGSLARHMVNRAISHAGIRPAPYATATVNLVGCLVIGVLAGLIASGRLTLTPAARAFVFVGILGGFTTFSSFGLDTLTLATTGQRGLAFGNVLFQVVFGLCAVFGGYYAVK